MADSQAGAAAGRPIRQCYWVAPGKFLAGEYPRDLDGPGRFDKLRALEAAGVTLFVDLTEEGELLPYSGELESARHLRFEIRDADVPDSARQTAGTLDAIDECIGGGGLVYLHCWGGVGRTGTIVGCWLVRRGLDGDAALRRLAELWRECPKSRRHDSPETWRQRDYVRSWREPG